MAREIRCAECGAKCFDTDSYCPKCSASISVKDIKKDDMLEGIEIEKWKKFIDDKSVDYIEIFRKNENKKFFASFNIWAFLFGSSWVFYRKMYLEGIITVLLEMLVVILCAFLKGPLMLAIFPIVIIFKMLVGVFAHCVYRNYVKKQLSKGENSDKKGGTSFGAVIIAALVTSLFASLVIWPLALKIIVTR